MSVATHEIAAVGAHLNEVYPMLPFTPVRGPRVLASDDADRDRLLEKALDIARQVSSLHVLFAEESEAARMRASGMMMRQTVQFHWQIGRAHV